VPRLSIIIPWRDDNTAFEDTLVSVLQNRPEHCEVLVVHPHEYQDPYGLDDEVRYLASSAATELDRINDGIAAARGEILHVLRCGLEVIEGWVEPALAEFADQQVALVAPLIVQRGDRQRLATAGVSYQAGGTRRLCGVGQRLNRLDRALPAVIAPTLSAGFYRRDLVAAWGGFDVTVGQQLADVDLGLTFRELEYQCVVSRDSRVVGEVETSGGQGFRQGRDEERLYWRHADPGAGLLELARHLLTVAGSSLRALPSPGALTQLAGRLVGWSEHGLQRQFRQRVTQFATPDLLAIPAREQAEAERQPLRRAA
jgi:hypothetical protein